MGQQSKCHRWDARSSGRISFAKSYRRDGERVFVAPRGSCQWFDPSRSVQGVQDVQDRLLRVAVPLSRIDLKERTLQACWLSASTQSWKPVGWPFKQFELRVGRANRWTTL